jgi:hypothetical protein
MKKLILALCFMFVFAPIANSETLTKGVLQDVIVPNKGYGLELRKIIIPAKEAGTKYQLVCIYFVDNARACSCNWDKANGIAP